MPASVPPEPDFKGLRSARKWASQLLAYVKATRPVSGVGTQVIEAPNGAGSPINATAASASGSSLPTYPTEDGVYVLGVTVTSGVGVLSWIETDTCA